MPIVVNLDVIMAKCKMSLNELLEKVDITLSNLSILKTGKAKAVCFSNPEAICKALDCQPGDIFGVCGRHRNEMMMNCFFMEFKSKELDFRMSFFVLFYNHYFFNV